MSVSLNTIAGTVLGETGAHNMEDAFLLPYTRTVAAGTLVRLNPFSINDGDGPSSFVAPHTLGDFDNYGHTRMHIGDAVAIVMGTSGWSVSWGAAAGFQADVCKYRVYWKNTGTSEDLSSLPLTGASPAFIDAGASLSIADQSVSVGDWIAVVVVVEFNDGRTVLVGGSGFPGAIGQNELTGADEGVHSLNAKPSPTPGIPTAVQINPAVGSCDGETTATLRVSISGFTAEAQTLEVSKNDGAYGVLVTTIVAGATYGHSGLALDNGDTYEFRASYTTGDGSYSDTDGIHHVECSE